MPCMRGVTMTKFKTRSNQIGNRQLEWWKSVSASKVMKKTSSMIGAMPKMTTVTDRNQQKKVPHDANPPRHGQPVKKADMSILRPDRRPERDRQQGEPDDGEARNGK